MFSPLDESPHESFYNIENNEQQQHTPSVATFLVVPIFSQYQIFYVRCLTCVCYKFGALFCVSANIGGIKACHKKLGAISFTLSSMPYQRWQYSRKKMVKKRRVGPGALLAI